jgi:hypothetical protein
VNLALGLEDVENPCFTPVAITMESDRRKKCSVNVIPFGTDVTHKRKYVLHKNRTCLTRFTLDVVT